MKTLNLLIKKIKKNKMKKFYVLWIFFVGICSLVLGEDDLSKMRENLREQANFLEQRLRAIEECEYKKLLQQAKTFEQKTKVITDRTTMKGIYWKVSMKVGGLFNCLEYFEKCLIEQDIKKRNDCAQQLRIDIYQELKNYGAGVEEANLRKFYKDLTEVADKYLPVS